MRAVVVDHRPGAAEIAGIDDAVVDSAPEALGDRVLLPAERVGELTGQTLLGALLQAQREAVVPGISHRIPEPRDAGVVRKWPQELRGVGGAPGQGRVTGADDAEEGVRHRLIEGHALREILRGHGVAREVGPQMAMTRPDV